MTPNHTPETAESSATMTAPSLCVARMPTPSAQASANPTISTIAESSPETAADRVFNVTELLQLIVVHLRPTDQVVAHQVCRTWRNMINNSRRIYPLAFPWEEPLTTVEYLIWEPEENVEKRASHLKGHAQQPRLSEQSTPFADRIARVNPKLRIKRTMFFTGIEFSVDKVLSWEGDFWRKQQILQPPLPVHELNDRWGGSYINTELSGTTLGDLYDCLKRRYSRPGWFPGKGPKERIDLYGLVMDNNIHVQAARAFAAGVDLDKMPHILR